MVDMSDEDGGMITGEALEQLIKEVVRRDDKVVTALTESLLKPDIKKGYAYCIPVILKDQDEFSDEENDVSDEEDVSGEQDGVDVVEMKGGIQAYFVWALLVTGKLPAGGLHKSNRFKARKSLESGKYGVKELNLLKRVDRIVKDTVLYVKRMFRRDVLDLLSPREVDEDPPEVTLHLHEWLRVVFNRQEQTELVNFVHEESGHGGRDIILQKAYEGGWGFKGLVEAASKQSDRCTACCLENPLQSVQEYPNSLYSIRCWEIIQTDFTYGLDSSLVNFYKLHWYDHFSKYCVGQIFFSRDEENVVLGAKEVGSVIRLWTGEEEWGILMCDNEFKGKLLRKYIEDHEGEVKNNRPRRPQTTGGVERVNRTLNTKTKKSHASRRNEEMVDLHPETIKNYNKTPHSALKIRTGDLSPLEAVILLHPKNSTPYFNVGVKYSLLQEETNTTENRRYIKEFIEKQIQEKQHKSFEARIRRFKKSSGGNGMNSLFKILVIFVEKKRRTNPIVNPTRFDFPMFSTQVSRNHRTKGIFLTDRVPQRNQSMGDESQYYGKNAFKIISEAVYRKLLEKWELDDEEIMNLEELREKYEQTSSSSSENSGEEESREDDGDEKDASEDSSDEESPEDDEDGEKEEEKQEEEEKDDEEVEDTPEDSGEESPEDDEDGEKEEEKQEEEEKEEEDEKEKHDSSEEDDSEDKEYVPNGTDSSEELDDEIENLKKRIGRLQQDRRHLDSDEEGELIMYQKLLVLKRNRRRKKGKRRKKPILTRKKPIFTRKKRKGYDFKIIFPDKIEGSSMSSERSKRSRNKQREIIIEVSSSSSEDEKKELRKKIKKKKKVFNPMVSPKQTCSEKKELRKKVKKVKKVKNAKISNPKQIPSSDILGDPDIVVVPCIHNILTCDFSTMSFEERKIVLEEVRETYDGEFLPRDIRLKLHQCAKLLADEKIAQVGSIAAREFGVGKTIWWKEDLKFKNIRDLSSMIGLMFERFVNQHFRFVETSEEDLFDPKSLVWKKNQKLNRIVTYKNREIRITKEKLKKEGDERLSTIQANWDRAEKEDPRFRLELFIHSHGPTQGLRAYNKAEGALGLMQGTMMMTKALGMPAAEKPKSSATPKVVISTRKSIQRKSFGKKRPGIPKEMISKNSSIPRKSLIKSPPAVPKAKVGEIPRKKKGVGTRQHHLSEGTSIISRTDSPEHEKVFQSRNGNCSPSLDDEFVGDDNVTHTTRVDDQKSQSKTKNASSESSLFVFNEMGNDVTNIEWNSGEDKTISFDFGFKETSDSSSDSFVLGGNLTNFSQMESTNPNVKEGNKKPVKKKEMSPQTKKKSGKDGKASKSMFLGKSSRIANELNQEALVQRKKKEEEAEKLQGNEVKTIQENQREKEEVEKITRPDNLKAKGLERKEKIAKLEKDRKQREVNDKREYERQREEDRRNDVRRRKLIQSQKNNMVDDALKKINRKKSDKESRERRKKKRKKEKKRRAKKQQKKKERRRERKEKKRKKEKRKEKREKRRRKKESKERKKKNVEEAEEDTEYIQEHNQHEDEELSGVDEEDVSETLELISSPSRIRIRGVGVDYSKEEEYEEKRHKGVSQEGKGNLGAMIRECKKKQKLKSCHSCLMVIAKGNEYNCMVCDNPCHVEKPFGAAKKCLVWRTKVDFKLELCCRPCAKRGAIQMVQESQGNSNQGNPLKMDLV